MFRLPINQHFLSNGLWDTAEPMEAWDKSSRKLDQNDDYSTFWTSRFWKRGSYHRSQETVCEPNECSTLVKLTGRYPRLTDP